LQGRMCGGGTTVAHHLGKLQPQGRGRNAACDGLSGGERTVPQQLPWPLGNHHRWAAITGRRVSSGSHRACRCRA
jgi:hypothetical protein